MANDTGVGPTREQMLARHLLWALSWVLTDDIAWDQEQVRTKWREAKRLAHQVIEEGLDGS